MVSNILQPPKPPTEQLWGNSQGKTGPASMILRFFQLHHLADHYNKIGFVCAIHNCVLQWLP
jgi:hypothetical protein